MRLIDGARAGVENAALGTPPGWQHTARRRAAEEIEAYARALRDVRPG